MRYVIVGNGVASIRAAEAIRRRDPLGDLVIISDEPYLAYSRPLTSYLIAGKVTEAQMEYRGKLFYEANRIDLKLGVRATGLDAGARRLALSNGEELTYDALLLATGSTPVMPDLPGKDLGGVSGLRTLDDARAISARAATAERAIVLGGGFCGMTAARGLHQRGLKVTVVVSSDRLLSQMLDKEAGDMVRAHLEEKGFEIRTGSDVAGVEGNGSVESVTFVDGSRLDAQLVVIGKGVRPNRELAEQAGLSVGKGIQVDEFMRTSDPNIYSAGDVAEGPQLLGGSRRIVAIWPNAAKQGKLAGENMSGGNSRFSGALPQNSLDFFGLPVIAIGNSRGGEGSEVLTRRERGYYRRVVLQGDRIVGAIFVGGVDRAGIVSGLIRDAVPARGFVERILEPGFGFMHLPEKYRREKIASA